MSRLRFALMLCCGFASTVGPLLAEPANSDSQDGLPPNFADIKNKAADGDANAEFQLGQLSEDSARKLDPKAADQRYADAVRWYRAAADQGQPQALNNLGAMLVDGRGLPQDALTGASYYRRAAQAGSAEAKTNLAIMILKKRIAGSDHEALDDLKQASELGFAPAEAQLAQIYLDGLLVSPDDNKAAGLFKQSADQHYAWGEYGYALMLQSGSGVPRDLPQAEVYMERAAAVALPAAEFDLSRMLDLGLGVSADKKRADLLLKSAARQGEPRAQERLRQLQPPVGHPLQ